MAGIALMVIWGDGLILGLPHYMPITPYIPWYPITLPWYYHKMRWFYIFLPLRTSFPKWHQFFWTRKDQNVRLWMSLSSGQMGSSMDINIPMATKHGSGNPTEKMKVLMGTSSLYIYIYIYTHVRVHEELSIAMFDDQRVCAKINKA